MVDGMAESEPRADAAQSPAPTVTSHEAVPVSTGEPRVDAALDRLGELAGSPIEDHVEILGDVHGRLTSALADLAEEGGADGAA